MHCGRKKVCIIKKNEDLGRSDIKSFSHINVSRKNMHSKCMGVSLGGEIMQKTFGMQNYNENSTHWILMASPFAISVPSMEASDTNTNFKAVTVQYVMGNTAWIQHNKSILCIFYIKKYMATGKKKLLQLQTHIFISNSINPTLFSTLQTFLSFVRLFICFQLNATTSSASKFPWNFPFFSCL